MKIIPIFSKKIKSAEEFNKAISANHTPVYLLGIKKLGILPKFKVNQDVFESATKHLETITIGGNCRLKLNGEGDSSLNLVLRDKSRFIAPKGSFGNVDADCSKVKIKESEDFTAKGSLKGFVRTVRADFKSLANAHPKVDTVWENAQISEASKPRITNVLGDLTVENYASPKIRAVDGKTKITDYSTPDISIALSDVTVEKKAEPIFDYIEANLNVHDSAKPFAEHVDKDVHASMTAKPKVKKIIGNLFVKDHAEPEVESLSGNLHFQQTAKPKVGYIAGMTILHLGANARQVLNIKSINI